MKIWEVAVRKPVFAWMFMLAMIFFGLIAYQQLGISQNPDIDFPVVNVSLNWEGAAPEVIELDVIDTIEGALSTINGVKSMNSTGKRGQANISVEFVLNKDIDLAVQEVQNKMLQAQRNLPKDIEPAIISKVNPEDKPIMWLSVTTQNLTPRELMTYVRDKIKDKFLAVDGVSDIILGGYVEPNLRVWPNLAQLKRYELSPLDLINAIKSEQLELPAGSLQNDQKELIVRAMGETTNIEDFKKISINRRGGSANFTPIMLQDVATMENGLADIQRISRVDGKSSIGLGIRKQRGANAVKLGNKIKEKLLELQKNLPPGIEIGINFDGTSFIQESIDELKFTILISILMTSLVVWIFIGSFNATSNILQSIPTVLLGTIFVLKLLGFTLNTFTMLALTLAVGMIVDDNIMVLENINRWFDKTKDWTSAAIHGTAEIFAAVVATSIAVVAIFLPIGYMEGIVGKFFYQFSVTLSVAILISMLDALIFTPMRASQLAKKNRNPQIADSSNNSTKLHGQWMNQWVASYQNVLHRCLNHPWKTLLLSLIVLLPTFFLMSKVKKEFIPAQDQSLLMLMIKTAPGSSLAYTDAKVKEVEKILLKTSQIQRYFVSVGGFQGNESNSAFAYITLQSPKARAPLGDKKHPNQIDIADYLRAEFSKNLKDLFVMVQDPSTQGFSQGRGQNSNVEFKITGPDWNELSRLTEVAQKIMNDSQLVQDVDTNFKGKVTELRIYPDREKMSTRGVSVEDVAKTVQATLSGIVVSKMSYGGRRFDIRVKLADEDLKDLNIIKKIPVPNNRGQMILLGDICKIMQEPGFLSVLRQDRERAVSVFGQSSPKNSLDQVITQLKNNIAQILPAEYQIEVSGAAKEFKSTMTNFLLIFLLGIAISYMVLASQFNSFRDPIIILMALPFSITGAFLALYITGFSLNLYSMIGLILLAGIVKKNSIMLVEFTQQIRARDHLSMKEALLHACPLRLRPIVMTTLTTIAGTLPAALALGPGAETRIPMAVTVIGGLLLSTLLTLFIVPSFMLILYPKK